MQPRLRPKRIVMLGSFGLWKKSTMGVRALPMAQALVRRGHRVTMLVPPWDDPAESGKSMNYEGVRVENLRVALQSGPAHHLGYAFQLWARALALRPDVIHIFKPKAHAGLAAYPLRYSLSWRARLVMDEDDWEGTGGWNEMEHFSAPQKALIAHMERWGLTHANTTTIASRALETLVWSLGVPRARTFYVPNGIAHPSPPRDAAPNLRTETRRLYGIDDATPVALLYTRFFEFKPERLATIWQQVTTVLPDALLLVAGTGLHGEEELFHAAACRAGLEERVRMLGWIKPSQLPGLCAAADLGLYPFDDNLLNRTKCPVKLIDLLCTGLPVVADRVGQIAEYIEDNRSGLLVQPGSSTAFASAVARLLNHSDERQQIGEHARQRMLDCFHWDTLVETVEQAYR